MNLIDLPDMMREHSAHDPAPVLAESRMTGIQRKVVAAHRRRVAGAVAGVVAVALGVAMAGTPFLHDFGISRRAIPPATPAVKTINGFPEYAIGGRLVGTATASLDKQISLTITPTNLSFEFSDRCSVIDPTIEIDIAMELGNGSELEVSCTPGGGGYASEDSLASDHLQPGVPAVFTFSAKAYRLTIGSNGDPTGRTPTAMPAGTYSVGVWQKLPFNQYPLPPRPKKLPVLNVDQFGLGAGNTAQTVYSDPADPLAPRTVSFTMPDCGKDPDTNCNPTAATSQTPGVLHIAVNGVEVNTAAFWDYSGGGSWFEIAPELPNAVHLHAGELVTITITPEYVTGAWEFAVAPGLQR